MTHTGRIRLFLLFVAILPPLVIMIALYQLSNMKQQEQERREIADKIDFFNAYHTIIEDRALADFTHALQERSIQNAATSVMSGRPSNVPFPTLPRGFSFIEFFDSDLQFVATHHRPGLINEYVDTSGFTDGAQIVRRSLTTEYDLNGPHMAITFFAPIGENMFLYGGRYLDRQYMNLSKLLIGSELHLYLDQEKRSTIASMTENEVYELNDSLQVRLLSDTVNHSYLVASFPLTTNAAIVSSQLLTVSIIATLSILLALLLGFYLTGRTKREVDNLIEATTRVAGGDFTTPVMAYEEGEFSQLADSFSEMTLQLRNIRQRLSISEKIAAWQIMGRKIAHEIKNPLTPIAISADDLKSSYQENLPDFPKILDETTSMIKSEVLRLSKLLDQFTAFARMNPPIKKRVSIASLSDELTKLFRTEVENDRLIIHGADKKSIDVDPDQLRQVLINLIKNGLETNEQPKVTVSFEINADGLSIEVSDNGTGFTEDLINNGPQPYQTTKENGTGLGLIICQRIVHDHNGQMTLSNSQQGGGRVLIKLPQ